LILRHRTAPVSPLRQLASRALASLPVLVLLVACSSGTTPTTAAPPTAAPPASAPTTAAPPTAAPPASAPTTAAPPTAAPPASAPTAGASTTTAAGTPTGAAHFPDIVRVMATRNADGSYGFEVTVSSPYDTPERYADGWHLLTPEGQELAVHRLTHDHQREQPFTRTQSAVPIPAGINRVVVEGHDQRSGYGGKQVAVALPDR